MRVLHFYKTALPDTMGGVEQVIHQIASVGTKLGVKSDVLALTADKVEPSISMGGYSLHRAPLDFQLASTGFSASVFRRFADLANQADLIHYHFPWPFMDVVHFATRINKPTVVTYHSDIVRQKFLLKLYRPLKLKFLASVDSIVATSPNYLSTSEVLTRFSDKVTVIPIGLDKGTYAEPSLERLKYWDQKLGSKFFLFIGVIRYYKGLHILIEAAQGTNFPIVIVGAGPMEQELKVQAERLGVSKNIYFLGLLTDEDKVALLKLCYGIVFPSHLRSEAFGVTLLEGAMYGKPLISSEIGTGTTYINQENQTGLVIPPSDPFELRRAMGYLWDHPEVAAQMGHRAEQRFWDVFTADHMVKSYVELYTELINRQQPT